ncbi:MAG: DUF3445 domain-containing protein [Pseudoruegeria sp.]
MSVVLHHCYPLSVKEIRLGHRLPGVRPLEGSTWVLIDEAYAGQMALKRHLLSDIPDQVRAIQPGALAAARELLAHVLEQLKDIDGFELFGDTIQCPDDRRVALDWDLPLETLGQLIQEDLVILQKHGDEHVMTAAVLCFPASWTLSEKFGKPLMAIHNPVAQYDAVMGKRVQRMFDLVRPERPIWRHNALFYADPSLHHPRRENNKRLETGPDNPYFRSEKQCLFRLPESDAVVFSIHTWLLARESLSADQLAALVSG